MDNVRLAMRSEIFHDDEGVKIIKRCYLLAIGEDDMTSNAISVVLSMNIFDEPSEQKRLEVRVKMANLIVETCPEVLKSVTQLIPEFKAMFRFKDLYPNKKNCARRIELYTPIFMIFEKRLLGIVKATKAHLIENEI